MGSGSEADSEEELESSHDAEVFFLESEYETDDVSSESGYYTPPNSPQDQDEDLLTDDNDSRISEDGDINLRPALSSDTEPDSDSDNNDDIFDDDDDDVPWTVNLTSDINRKEPEEPQDAWVLCQRTRIQLI